MSDAKVILLETFVSKLGPVTTLDELEVVKSPVEELVMTAS